MPDAIDVDAHHGACFFAAGFAEHDQTDFHASRVPSESADSNWTEIVMNRTAIPFFLRVALGIPAPYTRH
jgi:hypothetical protein